MRSTYCLLAGLGFVVAACTQPEPLRGPVSVSGEFDADGAVSALREIGFAVDPDSNSLMASTAVAEADLEAACPTRLIRDPNPGDNARRSRFTDAETAKVVATISDGGVRLEAQGRYHNRYVNRYETYPCNVPPTTEQQVRTALGS